MFSVAVHELTGQKVAIKILNRKKVRRVTLQQPRGFGPHEGRAGGD